MATLTPDMERARLLLAFKPWSNSDQSYSPSNEGWVLRGGGGGARYRVPHIDNTVAWPTTFTTRGEALAYVERRAVEGSTLHLRALAEVERLNRLG